MPQLAEENDLLTHFANAPVPASGVSWLDELRRASLARFHQMGFPGPKEEAWRHTNFSPIIRQRFRPAHFLVNGDGQSLYEEFTFGDDAAIELVFVNGFFAPDLSKTDPAITGLTISTIEEAVQSHPGIVERHLAQQADIERNAFVALNTGCLSAGAFLHADAGVRVTRPVHLLFISTSSTEPTLSHPRVLVVLEDQSQLRLVSSFVGSKRGIYFSNAVTEVIAGQDCLIDHCTLQQQGEQGLAVTTTQVLLGERSNYISHVATLGGKLTRNDLNVVMAGEYAQATVNGLVYLGGDQHCDNHTLLDHAKPNCPSHELYKQVLSESASCVFKGKILVRPDAQKTDSKQSSKCLLLSDDAFMNSQPALEIYADDVKCTHGSTIGPVDEEQIFYLRSRGVSLDAARHLMTYAFLADITRRIKVEPVRRRLEGFFAAKQGLPQDIRIADLAAHDEAVVNL